MTRAVKALAPSNIAFLKYWGKSDTTRQWPANDSFSMTLAQCRTETMARPFAGSDHVVQLNGTTISRGTASGAKIFKHLDYLAERLRFSDRLAITTHNLFPTGCGIASSASGLAALTLAAVGAWSESTSLDELESKDLSRHFLADLARMGSGSAGRSLFGGYVQWERGATPEEQDFRPLHGADHWRLADTIALVSSAEKAVSSSSGHSVAATSPFFAIRQSGLTERRDAMLAALTARDLATLGTYLETEALEMHAVMATMTPAACYILPQTEAVIATVRRLRRDGLQAYVTLDAGPNVHIISTQEDQPILVRHLQELHPDLGLLLDHVGPGPELLPVEENARA